MKVTGIANGFKTDNPQRRERTLAAAAGAPPTPPPSAAVSTVPADRAVALAAQHDALSMLPKMPPPPDEEDLDVPAFIRKRAEIQ